MILPLIRKLHNEQNITFSLLLRIQTTMSDVLLTQEKSDSIVYITMHQKSLSIKYSHIKN